MFLHNLRYAWNVTRRTDLNGFVIHAVGVDAATSRNLPISDGNYILADPDIYLWGLDRDACSKPCERILTYEWVSRGSDAWPPAMPSNDAELEAIITQCLAWQANLGVTHLILPTPLINDPESSLDEYLRWVDMGIAVARGFDLSSFVTVAISDFCFPTFYEQIIDQITAREEIYGAYFCIETSGSEVAISREVARLLLDASYVGSLNGKKIIINFADIFGLACLAVGADAFVSGYEMKSRRLNLDDYRQRGGGAAFPKFLSLSTMTRYRSQRDLERIARKHLLNIFDQDQTETSNNLFRALRAGDSVASVAEWQEARGNVASAKDHLIERLLLASREITGMNTIREKTNRMMSLLANAEKNVLYLNARFEEDSLDDSGNHVGPWRSAFEQFLEENNL